MYDGREGELEYDFVVAPAASPRDILLEFDGTTFSVDANGDLVGGLADGEIRMRRPSVYQEIAGVRVPIHGEWALTAGGRARFEIGDYDRTKPLVIDPMLAYSTYLGGSRDDGPADIAVDAAGNAYVTGFTLSRNFPTTAGAFQPTFRARGDAFVTKLDPTVRRSFTPRTSAGRPMRRSGDRSRWRRQRVRGGHYPVGRFSDNARSVSDNRWGVQSTPSRTTGS